MGHTPRYRYKRCGKSQAREEEKEEEVITLVLSLKHAWHIHQRWQCSSTGEKLSSVFDASFLPILDVQK
jgi:hypothetical protein